jgi:Ca2+-binding RTX toxin-like protein
MTRFRSCAVGTIAVVVALSAPGVASATVTCDVQNGGNVDIRMTASNELAQVERSGTNIMVRDVFGPVTCLDFEEDPVTPTVAGTPAILASSEPGVTNVTFIVDDASGFSSLGTFVNLRSGASSLLSVRAGDFQGQMVFGTSGVDTDPGTNADLDITANNVPEMDGRGGFANPVNFSAQGGGTTGAALAMGIDFLGSSAPDTLIGSEGDDFFQAFAENDALQGRGGNDRIHPGIGADGVEGGVGTDVVDYGDLSAGVSVDLDLAGAQKTGGGGNDAISEIEDVKGTFLVDVLRGDAGPNRIEGAGGTDIIEGRGGVDELLAGPGNDEVNARDGGPDTVDCGGDTDTAITDQQGVDALTGCETVEFAPPPADPAADQPGPTVPPMLTPPARPAITSLRLAPLKFAALPSGPSARKADFPPRLGGTTVSFRLNTSASVTFRVARRLPGRRLVLVRGRFTRAAPAGVNRFRFTGRIGGDALPPGAYLLQATPRAGSGNGALARAAFLITPSASS